MTCLESPGALFVEVFEALGVEVFDVQDFVNTLYSGTTGGTFYSFYNDADGLDQLTTSGYKDYTKNTSNLFQWS